MFPPDSGQWIAIALLTPFWWALTLFVLAFLADVSPRWRPRVARLFNWLERSRETSANEPRISSGVAA